jgi:hypothetical protein
VRYREVYPGIDLVYYGNAGRPEFDFVVAPGAQPGIIRLAVSADARVEVDAAGDLVVPRAGGDVRLHEPAVYQEDEGGRRAVRGRYVLVPAVATEGPQPPQIGFEVEAYDPTRPLVIDPLLGFSSCRPTRAGSAAIRWVGRNPARTSSCRS